MNLIRQRHIQTIDSELLDEFLGQARVSPRRRAILRLHDGDWEHAHRMLNALSIGTYVRPHHHEDNHKGEGFIILCGKSERDKDFATWSPPEGSPESAAYLQMLEGKASLLANRNI
ncbi:MAG: WbuC family cupin fold metalloprotein [Blastocatellia bacterium]